MTDIIERLEKLVGIHIGDADIDNDLLDAIANIKQLREEIIELKTDCTTFILDLGKAIDEKAELQEEIERLQWIMRHPR